MSRLEAPPKPLSWLSPPSSRLPAALGSGTSGVVILHEETGQNVIFELEKGKIKALRGLGGGKPRSPLSLRSLSLFQWEASPCPNGTLGGLELHSAVG